MRHAFARALALTSRARRADAMVAVDGVVSAGADQPLLYAVAFDDGERLTDVREEELTRLKYQPKNMPSRIHEPLSYEDALRGPKAIKVHDRLRVWWEEKRGYEGVVTECSTLLGVDCRPTLAFRVAYDDGDDIRHVLGDYPLEKLTQITKRPEPLRHTRVTPRELSGKRTRADAADATLAPSKAGRSHA
jgi:hypothetical protein